jgi:hypothetical protein
LSRRQQPAITRNRHSIFFFFEAGKKEKVAASDALLLGFRQLVCCLAFVNYFATLLLLVIRSVGVQRL